MAGLMMGALGGMGQAAMQSGLAMQKGGIEAELENLRAENALNKTKALERFKIELGDQQRTAQVGRIDAAAGNIADTAVAGKQGLISAGITDKESWTPEQQAVVDQSLAADRGAVISDPMTRVRAAGMTGDLRGDQVADVEFKEARAKIQDRLAEVSESRALRAEKRADKQGAKAELQSTRMALSTVLKDIGTQEDKIQLKLLDPMLDPQQKAMLEKQFKALDQDRKEARNHLLKLAGIEPTAAEAAPAKNGWDSGTGEIFKDGKVIGTAKSEKEGRALYQNFDPNKTEPAKAAEKPGLIKTPAAPEYVPPPDSPAGKAAAMRENQRAESGRKTATQRQEAIDLAAEVLQSKDLEAAQRLQDLPGFGMLDTKTKSAVFRLISGR